jgi:uncharacterized membrane protein YhaH (DUF805 family)
MSDATTKNLDTRRSTIWAWIYAPDGRMARGDFFYAIFARALVLAFPLALIAEMTPISEGLRRAIPIWTLAIVLSAGGPMVRRLHDIGQSGLHAPWLCFSVVLGFALNQWLPHPITADAAVFFVLSWIPYLLVVSLFFWPGSKGPNRYGPPPA